MQHVLGGGRGVFGQKTACASASTMSVGASGACSAHAVFCNRSAHDAVHAWTWSHTANRRPPGASRCTHPTDGSPPLCRRTCQTTRGLSPRRTAARHGRQPAYVQALHHAILIHEIQPLAVDGRSRAHPQLLGEMPEVHGIGLEVRAARPGPLPEEFPVASSKHFRTPCESFIPAR